MNTRTITSSNAKLVLTVRSRQGVPILGPFQVQGFATDDAFASEVVDSAEAMMGVDGRMSAGFTPFITPMVITLQADSTSIDVFETWLSSQQTIRDILFAEGVLSLPGEGKAYTFVKGALRRVTPFPQGKKVLQPVTYEIAWESSQVAPITV